MRTNLPPRGTMSPHCGCYYMVYPSSDQTTNLHPVKSYLPQVDLVTHTTILSTASKTALTQTFVNPSSTAEIKECRYVFPLYEGVSVVGFSCEIGSRIISGIVKEKIKAKEVYDEAVARGETAGLLEQGATSDVFISSLGNIPAGEKLLVRIAYIGELKHDVGADGIRFTLPTKISPRYGHGESSVGSSTSLGGIAITVDISMPEESHLREVRSPSHPFAVTLGRTSKTSSESPHLSRASATLSLGTSALDKDFVLEIMYRDSGKPTALLESHPSVPLQRALMVSLVPQITTQLSKPEVIFVADQSGSMQGNRTQTLVAALKVFLKSLPVGIKFNICLFGDGYTFLFPKSQEYGKESLDKALNLLEGLNGNYGGTETLSAIRASIDSRDPNENLSVILATDGDIWQQEDLFEYLNSSVAKSKKSLRVFALGVGNSVSSALIEGVARAGNGFAQAVGEGGNFDRKIVRMLKGALTPDNGAYTVELQYRTEDDDDYVLVEKVTDSLRIMAVDGSKSYDSQVVRDVATSARATTEGEEDADTQMLDADGQARYTHLPNVPVPKLLQTPHNIPPLYPFSRTTVYILMSPDAAHGTPKSVIVKGHSADYPFQMEIPIEVLEQPGETVHQLAAKKAIVELQEGRGWLVHASDNTGTPVKAKCGEEFESMVEREAVRLGVEYQIAGKYTSFVADESEIKNPEHTKTIDADVGQPRNTGQLADAPDHRSHANACAAPHIAGFASSGSPVRSTNSNTFGQPNTTRPVYKSASATLSMAAPTGAVSWWGSFSRVPKARHLFGGNAPRRQLASRAASKPAPSTLLPSMPYEAVSERGQCLMPAGVKLCAKEFEEDAKETASEDKDPLQRLISLQTFEGFWELDAPLLNVVAVSEQHKVPEGLDLRSWATILAITYLEKEMGAEREAWEMCVDKARGWSAGVGVVDGKAAEKWWAWAEELITGSK